MAFDVKQCEKDGWKCDAKDLYGSWWPKATYLGRLMDGTHVIKTNSGTRLFVMDAVIRNIAKPKTIRWNVTLDVRDMRSPDNLVPTSIPLIEDDKGIRVDHSDAILEVLEGILDNCDESSVHPVTIIRCHIDRIKKDRGE